MINYKGFEKRRDEAAKRGNTAALVCQATLRPVALPRPRWLALSVAGLAFMKVQLCALILPALCRY